MAAEEKDDWLDDLDGEDDRAAAEIDQSDIDSLLSGGADNELEPAADEPAGVSQADLDALLAGEDDAAPSGQQADAINDTEAEGELDQADLDALLADTDSDADPAGSNPDQDEIDELFSEVDDEVPEESFEAEEIDFKDVIGDDQGEESAFDESSFDAEEFGLDDDIPDIPDIPDNEDDETTIFDEAATNFSASDDNATQIIAEAAEPAKSGAKKFQLPAFAIPAAFQNRKIQVVIGGSLVLLLTLALLFRGGDEQIPAELAESSAIKEETPAAEPAPLGPRAPNTAPRGTDLTLQLTLASDSNELAVHLAGSDAENDPLDFEILSLPEHGRLSGKAPNLIYIPNKNFPGRDSIVYRVTDGQEFSEAATIIIATPPPETTAARPEDKPKTITDQKLTIAAKGRSYNLASTDRLVIDWRKLWQEANYLPFSAKVEVEIIARNIHGTLQQVNSQKHSYRPDKYFGGTESIKYRFKLGKLKSEAQTLRFNIALGSPAPEIHLGKIDDLYNPGDTVVIDASATRDENRASVQFSWQQLSGVPVQYEFINEEGSQIAFVVPSSFNTIDDPGPVLRLTARDKTGKEDVQDIKVKSQSRRQTAIWRGLVDGEIAAEPAFSADNYPAALVSFP